MSPSLCLSFLSNFSLSPPFSLNGVDKESILMRIYQKEMMIFLREYMREGSILKEMVLAKKMLNRVQLRMILRNDVI